MAWTPQQEEAMRRSGKALLVSAAAGSGKTSVLTERIIRSLTREKNPASLSRMLIVTFTRASAADLKAKIAKALTKALAEHPGDAHLTRQLLELGSAQISTIDSFFQNAVRANFDALDLPATFRIAEKSEVIPICMRTLNHLMEVHYERASSEKTTSTDPLARLRQNAFAEAMDHLMSGRSDGKLEELMRKFYERFASYPQGIGLLCECAKELTAAADGEFFASRAGSVLCSYLKEQFSSALTFLTDTVRCVESDPALYKKCIGILNSDADYCVAVLHALEAGSYEQTRGAVYTFVSGRFPTIPAADTPDFLAAYKEWRGVLKKRVTNAQEALAWPVESIPDQCRRTAALCEALHAFYSDYEAALLKEKKTRGILEFDDIRTSLYRLLTTADGSPSPAARAIAEQYDAVYIDEYQDVDLLQDRIFAQIGSDRRFMVGDIKQSIYVFRGSEPSIFSDYRRRFPLYTEDREDSEGVCVFMSNNFRCDDPVIQFTNKVCGFLFSACEESIGYCKEDDLVFSKEAKPNPNSAPVRVAVFEGKPRAKKGQIEEDDAEEESGFLAEEIWVAREIARLLREGTLNDGRRITPSDIAILVRAKKHGVGIARALEALQIPVAAEAANNIMDEPLTVDLLNLLRVIDNPYRDIPLSEYLLSSLEGFTLEELTQIRAATPDRKSLFDAMQAQAERENGENTAKCREFCTWVEHWREIAATLPADKLLRLLYLDARLISYQGDPVLLFLYEQARIYQRTSFCSLYAFLDAMQKLREGDAVSADGLKKAQSAVSIMTVHHSKGLEYPVVFLSASGKGFNKDDLKKKLLFHRSTGVACKLYNKELGDMEDSVLHTAARIAVDAEQTEEGIRTLYVALTRAREKLYVTGTLSGGRESACLSASLIRRGDRAAILHCNSYLAWILAALQKNDENAPYQLEFFSHIPEHPLTDEAEMSEDCTDAAVALPLPDDALTVRYADILRKNAEFAYPLAFLRGLPTKAAASKLSPNLLDRLDADEGDPIALQTQLDLMEAAQPSFDELLRERDKPSAAEIGTATHAFLQFCDFDRLAKDGVEAEMAHLIAEKFISAATAEAIDVTLLEKFRSSDLMHELRAAKRVYREQQFNLFVPFDELTEKQTQNAHLAEHSLFVQGSIDLLIETADGELLLVDYKTDRMTADERRDPAIFCERLRASHKNQLTYYQRAAYQLFGKFPDQTFIYSIPFGSMIKL